MKIEVDSSLNEKPTPAQLRAIVGLSRALGIKEPLEELKVRRLRSIK